MEYELIHSRKRSLSLTVDQDGKVIVRVPDHTPKYVADDFVRRHEEWIAKKKKEAEASPKYQIDDNKMEELRAKAKAYLPQRAAYFAEIMGVHPEKITITSARKRFGSCNSKGNISFSLYLMLYPEKAVDYVVVHELAHLKELNHSKNFYNLVENILPDYKSREKMLR